MPRCAPSQCCLDKPKNVQFAHEATRAEGSIKTTSAVSSIKNKEKKRTKETIFLSIKNSRPGHSPGLAELNMK